MLGAPECGFFMDAPHADGKPDYTPQYQWVAKAQNVSGAVNAACAAAHTGEDAWKCFMAQYTLPHVKTPFFAVNSVYDAWQSGNIIRIPGACAQNEKACTAPEAAAFNNLRATMLGNLTTNLPLAPKGAQQSGFFTYDCVTHCGPFNHDARWNTLTDGARTLRGAFTAWYRGAVVESEGAAKPGWGPQAVASCG